MTNLLPLPVAYELRSAPSPVVAELLPLHASDQMARQNSVIRLMYGETYDEYPLPIDGLKFYAWLAIVAAQCAEAGLEVVASVLVADSAVQLNKLDEWGADRITARTDDRVRTAERFLESCGAGSAVEVIRMSEVVEEEAFARYRCLAGELLLSSDAFRATIEGSVREDRVEAERTKGFLYSLDEAALVALYDVKVGPPREQFYDDAARLIAQSESLPELVSVILRPSYPLGLRPGEFVRNKELALYGVTPYKASSLRYRQHRVTTESAVSDAIELLRSTPIVNRTSVPQPVVEFSTTLQLIEWALEMRPPATWLAAEWDANRISNEDLRAAAIGLCERVMGAIR